MKDRGRQLEQILHQYITYVKPAFEEFCLPVSRNFRCYLVLVIPEQHSVVLGILSSCVIPLVWWAHWLQTTKLIYVGPD